MGTRFVSYDNGKRPEQSIMRNEIRQEFCAIIYEQNVLGFKGNGLIVKTVVTVMLVTSLCWWLYDRDRFNDENNISNMSSTQLVSNIRHQHPCNSKRLYGKNHQHHCSRHNSLADIIAMLKSNASQKDIKLPELYIFCRRIRLKKVIEPF